MSNKLAEMDKLSATRFLLGWGAGSVTGALDGFEVKTITEKTLGDIQKVIIASIDYHLALSKLIYPGIENYPIEVNMDEHRTEITLGFHDENGNYEEAPYKFNLLSLGKNLIQ